MTLTCALAPQAEEHSKGAARELQMCGFSVTVNK